MRDTIWSGMMTHMINFAIAYNDDSVVIFIENKVAEVHKRWHILN